MKSHCTHALCAHITMVLLAAAMAAAAALPVYSKPENTANAQQHPDIDDGIVVWAETVNGFSGVYGLDLIYAPDDLINVASYADSDQDRPAIWFDRVVFQDNFDGDWDIYVADISDPANPIDYLITWPEQDQPYNQENPAIHGNTIVWQDEFAVNDWDIFAADVTDPNNPDIYLVALADENQYSENQQAPAIYRNRIVWQDQFEGVWDIATTDFWLRDFALDGLLSATDNQQENPAVWGDWVVWQEDIGNDYNIYAADISDPANPGIIELTTDTADQTNPDISGHLVVWQDNRNGHWDIYGYNLITNKEFRVDTEPEGQSPDTSNQTEPAISGAMVVWTDDSVSPAKIYYTDLDPVDAADCPMPLPGDANGDCRIDLTDVAAISQNWLACKLEPAGACTQ